MHVFVFTRAPAGDSVDADAKKRNEIVADLKEKLANKATLEVVFDKDAADLTVEVMGQEHYRSQTTVRLAVGDYFTEITKKSRGLIGGGGIGATSWVAGQLANAIESWAKDNRDRLAAYRLKVEAPAQ